MRHSLTFFEIIGTFAYITRRRIEQLAARRAHNPEVVGSSPTPAIKKASRFGDAFFIIRWRGLEGFQPPTEGRKRGHGWPRQVETPAWKEATGHCRLEGESYSSQISELKNWTGLFRGIP